jgi:phytoene synthase
MAEHGPSAQAGHLTAEEMRVDPALAERLGAALRQSDPDRYFAALFVPLASRPYVMALYAFNVELARVAHNVHEPMLGAIRLEWWRETAEKAAGGHARDHDVARGLTAMFAATPVTLAELEALAAARAFDFSPDRFQEFPALEQYLDATSGALMRMAAKIAGGDPAHVGTAGLAYGLTGILRSLALHNERHKLFLPLDLLAGQNVTPEDFFHLQPDAPARMAIIMQAAARAREHFLVTHHGPRPGSALAAMLPAALVPAYLRNLKKGRDVSLPRRQIALLTAALRGRI